MNGPRGGKSRQHEKKEAWIDGYMHLSVLFIASEQHIGRCLEGKVADIVPVDDGGGWDVGLALRLRGWRLHL